MASLRPTPRSPTVETGAATAGTFVWSVDANGAWTDATKWKYQPGSGPAGIGYPTNPGDVAILGDETTAITGPRCGR